MVLHHSSDREFKKNWTLRMPAVNIPQNFLSALYLFCTIKGVFVNSDFSTPSIIKCMGMDGNCLSEVLVAIA
ncbi:hypothetical protein, partial [Rossellomorea marisflavi]|uniref:hypothetical protein n=1 Tax=Rossellomorea marisflavi TaxID=189381 RepID=UPI003519C78E